MQPRRLSSAREVSRPLGSSTGCASITATSPTRTSSRAWAPSRAPMSMCISRMSATFLRSSSRSRWIGFLPTTPVTGPSAVSSDDALADQDLRVPAADRPEPQVALVVDVGDDQPDLVDVAHHEQARRARASKPCFGATRASGVPITSVLTSANALGRVAPHRGGGGLVAGRPARGEQVAAGACGHAGPRRVARAPRATRPPGHSCGRAAARRTYWRIPPWRKYSASRGVSMRTRASNCTGSRAVALGARPAPRAAARRRRPSPRPGR